MWVQTLALLNLAGEAGDLAKRFAENAYRKNVDALRGDLLKLIRPLARAAIAAEEGAAVGVKRSGSAPCERASPPQAWRPGCGSGRRCA